MLLGGLDILREKPQRVRAIANAGEVDAAAVVGELDHHFVADLPYLERDLACFRLAGFDAIRTRLDAVVERIAQQVLERPDQLFQHRAIELGLPVVDLQVRALVELLRRRAQNPIQSFGQADERNRANREQPLLHVARQARLRQQRGVGVVQILEQRLLHGGHVVHAFRERTRELLEPRKAIELQRIELLIDRLDRRHPRLDLRFRLQFDFAHLSAQAYHAIRELEEINFPDRQGRRDLIREQGQRNSDEHQRRSIDEEHRGHYKHEVARARYVGGLGRLDMGGCRGRERDHDRIGGFRRRCQVMRRRRSGADDARRGIRRNIAGAPVEFRQRHVGATVA